MDICDQNSERNHQGGELVNKIKGVHMIQSHCQCANISYVFEIEEHRKNKSTRMHRQKTTEEVYWLGEIKYPNSINICII